MVRFVAIALSTDSSFHHREAGCDRRFSIHRFESGQTLRSDRNRAHGPAGLSLTPAGGGMTTAAGPERGVDWGSRR